MTAPAVRAESYYAGNDLYPNSRSYAMSSVGGRRRAGNDNRLRRAVLYSAKATSSTTGFTGTFTGATNAAYNDYGGSSTSTEIVTTLRKPFQFNPPSLILGIQVAPTAPSASEIAAGSLPQQSGYIGSAGSSVEMLFERSMEVYGNSGEYKRLGVAKDILDVIAVLRGDPELLKASDDKTIREFTHNMTDLVGNGSDILMSYRAAIAYSPDLVVYGMVTSLTFRFLQFNRDLIPTMGYVDMTFDVHNANNAAGVAAQQVGVDAANAVDTPTGRRASSGWGGGGPMRVS